MKSLGGIVLIIVGVSLVFGFNLFKLILPVFFIYLGMQLINRDKISK